MHKENFFKIILSNYFRIIFTSAYDAEGERAWNKI